MNKTCSNCGHSVYHHRYGGVVNNKPIGAYCDKWIESKKNSPLGKECNCTGFRQK